ncbi:MAG TPA: fumarate/nitrate reduction transcriptional regulator Fnr [Burkholderiaceae bacterium]|jgi:CRP/FNR family transcriptional regulator
MLSPVAATPIKADALKAACAHCNLRELCLPVGLSDKDLDSLDAMVAMRRSVRRGQLLFRTGDRFEAVYAVRSGFFKTQVAAQGGGDQVIGFQMAGELLGLDGIGTESHSCDAVALEDSQVCVIPFARLEELSRECGDLQRQFHRLMSREIVRDHGVMLMLGTMRAEARVAAFLLNLTRRLQARGFSPSALVLRMTRAEIGTYLGLKLETVSRCFSKFQEDGLLAVKQRQIRVLDQQALEEVVSRVAR